MQAHMWAMRPAPTDPAATHACPHSIPWSKIKRARIEHERAVAQRAQRPAQLLLKLTRRDSLNECTSQLLTLQLTPRCVGFQS